MKQFFYLLVVLLSINITAQETLPSAEIKTLDGTSTSLQELGKNNDIIVISLWATWCVPCKNELDAINDVYTDWQDETGVKVTQFL